MSDLDHAFGYGLLKPEEVALLRDIYSRILAEPWFSRRNDRQDEFAKYMLHIYSRGMVVPHKLEALCRTAARAHFASDEGLPLPRTGTVSHNILVVEDEMILARDIRKRLAAAGATVVGPVATVNDALNLVEDCDLNCALLDVVLNGELVYPVAARLRVKNVPFAFISGYDKPDMPATFRNVTMFPKPADWTKVAAYLLETANSAHQFS
jgi:CheY-like chemotaxis protein